MHLHSTRRAPLASALGAVALIAALPFSYAGQGRDQGEQIIEIASDLQVLDVKQGVFAYDEASHQVVFSPATAIKRDEARTYGWRAQLKTSRASVRVVERMTLPSAPDFWGIGAGVTISSDRRTATTERALTVSPEGQIENAWMFSAGDPAGRYTVTITIEGIPVTTMHMTVD